MSHSVLKNMFWRFAERCGAQLVAFIVSVVLARVLSPADYGTIALITVFTSILQVFVDSGLGNALIQKDKADDLDFSTVFYFNIIFCIVIYILLFFCAPFISLFYERDDLIPYIRVLAVTILIAGFKNVLQAYISKMMMFKLFFKATLIGTVCAAFVGIVMAYTGFGVWALIAQQLTNAMLDTIFLWFFVEWRPKFIFSTSRLKGLLSYGWKILASRILGVTYDNIQSLIIGKKYTSDSLAFFNQGQKFPNLVVTNINASIDSVLLPAMAVVQNDLKKIKRMTKLSVKISSYIMFPLMIGLAVVSDNIVCLLLTEKWLECVPYMRIFCVVFMFYPIHNANLTAISAIGRSDIFLKLEIEKKIVGLLIIVISAKYGVMAIALGTLINGFISQFINAYPNKRLIDYGCLEQIKDIVPNMVIALIMGGVVYWVNVFNFNLLITLGIQIFLGGIVYILLSYILKLDNFEYLLDVSKKFMKHSSKIS